MSDLPVCPVCGTVCQSQHIASGYTPEGLGWAADPRYVPLIDSVKIEQMTALLREIRDYPIDGTLSHESIWRAFGRWTTQARMILGPAIPTGDAGYVINQRMNRPDEFSEAVAKNQADFVKLNEDLNVQIREAIEKKMKGE